MKKDFCIILFLMLIICNSVLAKTNSFSIQISPKVCKEGIINGPKRLFALYVFCDDAIGTTVGIIKRTTLFSKNITDNKALMGNWDENESDRFWTDPKWSRDVTDITWSKNGEGLTIKTSSMYGTGKTYYLNLPNKTYTSS